MKLLAIGDFHGRFKAIQEMDFDAVISPGDFMSSKQRRELSWKYMFEKKEVHEIVGKKKMKRIIMKDINAGKTVLDGLESLGKRVYMVPGNSDLSGIKSKWNFLRINNYQEIIKQYRNIINVDFKIKSFKGYDIIGYGSSSSSESKQRYKLMIKRLVKLFNKARKPVIFVSHNAPYKTRIDLVKNKDSPVYKEHKVSMITKTIINMFQPKLCIVGHFHEYQTSLKIGKTLVINPGYGYENKHAIIDLNKSINIKFY